MKNDIRHLDAYQLCDTVRAMNILNLIFKINVNSEPIHIIYDESNKTKNYAITASIAMTLDRMKIEGKVSMPNLRYNFSEVWDVVKDFKKYLDLCDNHDISKLDTEKNYRNIVLTDNLNFNIKNYDCIYISSGINKDIVMDSSLFRNCNSFRMV